MGEDTIRGRWALVTGASSGLGADFARELGRRGANLILVARRQDRLERLAAEIEAKHRVETDVIASDLSVPDARDALLRALSDGGRAIDILIKNAGLGVHGNFLDNSWEEEREVIEVDIIALVHLTKLLLPEMVSRGFGRILQLASTAAYQPVPSYAVYGAAKAFVASFGEALNRELKGTGVTCTVVSPGVTDTEFQAVARHEYTSFMHRVQMKSPQVARIAIRAMLKRRHSVVPGPHNALGAWAARLAPRTVSTAVAGFLMQGQRGPKL
ncbi:MAG: SDR family oxidoreductase [Gemmatimonadota bacterium]|nr:MAG: SDR family oxidoreductase [Gemmatimonadota bacterium]